MPQPPFWIRKLLHSLVSEELLEEISGDLDEVYSEIAATKGTSRANVYYFFEVLRFSKMYRKGRHYQSSNTLSMFQNYLKVAFRNILKSRLNTIINVTGLGVGLACVLIIFLYLSIETGYDKFHENGKNIYRLQHIYGFINAQAGPIYEREYSEVVASMRINPWTRNRRISVKDDQVFTEDILMAESNFFEFFSFPLVSGDVSKCLSEKYSVVLSESMNNKLFGGGSGVGQILKMEDLNGEITSLNVTGIFKDIPYYSHLQFEIVVPFQLVEDNPRMAGLMKSWPNDWVGTYVQLDQKADPEQVEAYYEEIWRKYVDPGDTVLIDFMPLEDLYLESSHLNNDYASHGNSEQVSTFMAIALIILLIASINFINLATARANKRSKEVGLRKTLGAHKKQLISQFLTESVLVTLIGFLVAGALVALVIPWVNTFAEVNLYRSFANPQQIIIAVILIFLFTALFTSIYPALVLSSFKPIDSLKSGSHKQAGMGTFRKVLVVGQFATSVVLIVSSLIIYDQMRFVKEKNLGFDVDNVLSFDFGSSDKLKKKWPVIKSQLEETPGVQVVANTRHVPGDNAYYWSYKFEGNNDLDNPYGDGWRGFYIGERMIEALDLELVMGRSFDPAKPMDSATFILNESGWKRAIEEYGDSWEDPIGKTIEYYTASSGDWALVKRGTVIGIVKDFHHHSLQMSIDPIVIHNIDGTGIVVKVTEQDTNKLLRFVEDKWSAWGAPVAFNHEYLRDRFNDHYKSEDRFNTFVLVFCMLAIAIACLGLYGLSLFSTQQRVKEIGIRKVLGASVPSLLKMLSLDFLKLVGLAIVIAVPVSIYFVSGWLENFAYRVDISIWHVFLGAFLAVIVAQFTISYNTLKAAIANPTKSLRTE
ncbi:MAG: FtsX-like permease family protein [Marinoscillum sp.]